MKQMMCHVFLGLLGLCHGQGGFKDGWIEVKCLNLEWGFSRDGSWKQLSREPTLPVLGVEGCCTCLNLLPFVLLNYCYHFFLFVPVGIVVHLLKVNNRTDSSGRCKCGDQWEILRNLKSATISPGCQLWFIQLLYYYDYCFSFLNMSLST